LDVVSKFMIYLTGQDENAKRVALVAMNYLGNSDLAADLAASDKSSGAVAAAAEIAAAPTASQEARRIAAGAVTAIARAPSTSPEVRQAAAEGARTIASAPAVPAALRDSALALLREQSRVTVPVPEPTRAGPLTVEVHRPATLRVNYRFWTRAPGDSASGAVTAGTISDSARAVLELSGAAPVQPGQRLDYWMAIGGRSGTSYSVTLVLRQGTTQLTRETRSGTLPASGLSVVTGTIILAEAQGPAAVGTMPR
jgi:hypothetical protein